MKQGRNLLPQGLINANKQEVCAGDCISWCQDEWNGVLIDCKTDMVAAINIPQQFPSFTIPSRTHHPGSISGPLVAIS